MVILLQNRSDACAGSVRTDNTKAHQATALSEGLPSLANYNQAMFCEMR
jgi:hypothetical protein